MKCPVCPTDIVPGQKFCPNCGARLPDTEAAGGLGEAGVVLQKAKVAEIHGDYELARRLASQAVELNPGDASAHLLLAEMEARFKGNDAALEHAQIAVDLRPDWQRAKEFLARAEKLARKAATPPKPLEPKPPLPPIVVDEQTQAWVIELRACIEKRVNANQRFASLQERQNEVPADRYDAFCAEYRTALEQADECMEKAQRPIRDEAENLKLAISGRERELAHLESADDRRRLEDLLAADRAKLDLVQRLLEANFVEDIEAAMPLGRHKKPGGDDATNRWLSLGGAFLLFISVFLPVLAPPAYRPVRRFSLWTAAWHLGPRESLGHIIWLLPFLGGLASATMAFHRATRTRYLSHIMVGTLALIEGCIYLGLCIREPAVFRSMHILISCWLLGGAALLIAGIRERREARRQRADRPHPDTTHKPITEFWRALPARTRALLVGIPLVSIALYGGYQWYSGSGSRLQIEVKPTLYTADLFGPHVGINAKVILRNVSNQPIRVGARSSLDSSLNTSKSNEFGEALERATGSKSQPSTKDTRYWVEAAVHDSQKNSWSTLSVEGLRSWFTSYQTLSPGEQVEGKVDVFFGPQDNWEARPLDRIRVIVHNEARWDRIEKIVSLPRATKPAPVGGQPGASTAASGAGAGNPDATSGNTAAASGASIVSPADLMKGRWDKIAGDYTEDNGRVWHLRNSASRIEIYTEPLNGVAVHGNLRYQYGAIGGSAVMNGPSESHAVTYENVTTDQDGTRITIYWRDIGARGATILTRTNQQHVNHIAGMWEGVCRGDTGNEFPCTLELKADDTGKVKGTVKYANGRWGRIQGEVRPTGEARWTEAAYDARGQYLFDISFAGQLTIDGRSLTGGYSVPGHGIGRFSLARTAGG